MRSSPTASPTSGRVFDQLPANDDEVEAVVDLAVSVVEYCLANPARYHLMFQRTIPGFQPGEESHQVALTVLGGLTERLAQPASTTTLTWPSSGP